MKPLGLPQELHHRLAGEPFGVGNLPRDKTLFNLVHLKLTIKPIREPLWKLIAKLPKGRIILQQLNQLIVSVE